MTWKKWMYLNKFIYIVWHDKCVHIINYQIQIDVGFLGLKITVHKVPPYLLMYAIFTCGVNDWAGSVKSGANQQKEKNRNFWLSLQ